LTAFTCNLHRYVVIASDGVWDVYDSVKAVKSIKSFGKVEAAAKKMCLYAREKREYGGLAMDDISTIVIDIGGTHGGGAGGSKRGGGSFRSA
jgi:serine/threonine protein phosphatase PrpC